MSKLQDAIQRVLDANARFEDAPIGEDSMAGNALIHACRNLGWINREEVRLSNMVKGLIEAGGDDQEAYKQGRADAAAAERKRILEALRKEVARREGEPNNSADRLLTAGILIAIDRIERLPVAGSIVGHVCVVDGDIKLTPTTDSPEGQGE